MHGKTLQIYIDISKCIEMSMYISKRDAKGEAQYSSSILFVLNVGGKFSLHDMQRNTNIGLKHIKERLFGQMSSYLKLRRDCD